MAKKRSLLDALKTRQEQAARKESLLESVNGAGQLAQAAGSAIALAPGVGAVAGAMLSVAGMALGYVAASFQSARMRADLEFFADCIDRLPELWAADGTLEERILPAVAKYLTWRAQETHKQKIQAARNHLRKKLMDGTPTPERDCLHQQVEKFLADCTVSELVLLIRTWLALRTNDECVEYEVSRHTGERNYSVREEGVAEAAGVSCEEAYYAFRSMSARGFVVAVGNTSRENDASFLGAALPASQNLWALLPLGVSIAEWLDENEPPQTDRAD